MSSRYWFEQGEPQTRADYTEAEVAGIPEVDLVARRFDRVMGIMQCA